MKRINIMTTSKLNTSIFCLIKDNCTIIATIIAGLLFFSACSHPRSVRPGNNFAVKTEINKDKPKVHAPRSATKVKKENIQPEQKEAAVIENIADEQTPEQNNSNSESISDIEPAKHLPTLKEQLNSIVEDQQTIIKDVNSLQSEVQSIKTDIQDIKSELLRLNGKKSDNAIKGPTKLSPVELDIEELPSGKDSVGVPDGTILSDEESSDKGEVYNAKPISKPTPSVPKKKQANKKTIQVNKSVRIPVKIQKQDPVEHKVISEDKPVKQSSNEALDIITAKNSMIHKDYNTAIDQLSKIAKTEKNPVVISDCHFYIGESHFGLHQYDKAITFYDKVVNSSVSNKRDEAQIKIAESNIRLGKADFAKKAYEDFVQKFPKSDLLPKARKMLQQL